MQRIDIDPALVRAVSQRFVAVAQSAEHAASVRLTFGTAAAGRRYPSEGDAVHRLVARRVGELSEWARAARDIGFELRCAADQYLESDRHSGSRIG